ncbi:beta-1,3-galactosyltransferase 2-like [Colossoma macropomum]|uniref:beta-1,3-galactosyltransferase 2-like n=1 Tax=Colossoma macropomum TaxID=42526 RepID=UPI001864A12E|nr:beta-1,3-galactosyltransferase 2-like [Colossoma macropomum]
MQWRRRHCCTNIAGFLFLLLCVGVFLIVSHTGKKSHQENGVTHTAQKLPRMELNHSMTKQNMWREKAMSPFPPRSEGNLTSFLEDTSQQGLKNSLASNASLSEEVRAGSILKVEPYNYIINEEDKCQEKDPFLVLLIAVEPQHVQARDAIRQTWGNESVAEGLGFVRLFLLGIREGLPNQLQRSIEAESLQYHDIIQQKYIDSYYNLTIKTLMGMHWIAKYCPGASYVMKTDSDMFVNMEYLIQKLLNPSLPQKRKYFTGYLMRGYSPNRNKHSKWYMPPELYPSKRYPTFCSGTGYIFSGDLAHLIYRASLSIRRLHLEDVYIGLCLAKLRIEPVPPPNEFLFNHWRVSYSSCKYSHLITSHGFHPTELIKYWHHLQSNKHSACINAPKEKDKVRRLRQRKLLWKRFIG